jgi:hypothetical protein
LAVTDEILSNMARYKDEQESELVRMVAGSQYANR